MIAIRIGRFLIIGLISNLINFFSFKTLYVYIPILNASLISYMVGFIFSFYFNKIWSFEIKTSVSKINLTKIILINTASAYIMAFSIENIHLQLNFTYNVSWLASAITITIINFISYEKFLR